MKPILIVPSGSITNEEKKTIQEGGYVVIISDKPEEIKMLTPISTTDGLDILNAAIMGIHKDYGNDGKKAFFAELARQIESRKK